MFQKIAPLSRFPGKIQEMEVALDFCTVLYTERQNDSRAPRQIDQMG